MSLISSCTTAPCNFTGLDSEDIAQHWDELAVLFEKPLKRTGADRLYEPDDVLWKCANYEWQCWAWIEDEIKCAFATYIESFPTGAANFVVYLVGGKDIEKWLDIAWPIFKMYAKEKGCDRLVGMGREGWLRALQRVEDQPFHKDLVFSVEIDNG